MMFRKEKNLPIWMSISHLRTDSGLNLLLSIVASYITKSTIFSIYNKLTSSSLISNISDKSHSFFGNGWDMNRAAVATEGIACFCKATISHKELSMAFDLIGSLSCILNGSVDTVDNRKLKRKSHQNINVNSRK